MLPRNISVHMFVCLLMVFINLVISQSVENVPTQNPCGNKVTCTECIQTRSCAWCMALDVGNTPRCFQPSSIQKSFCSEAETYNPANELKVTLKRQLTTRSSSSGGMYANGSSISGSYGYGTSGSYGAGGSYGFGGAAAHQDIVQIYPQRVSMQLRINQKQTLNISYSQAEDYPVDLYYLMDLSKSMEDDKTSLSFLGDKLSDTMRRITSNFHLGFGSFVDKVLMPYVSTVPKKLLHPCDDCEAPYGFRNHMPLSMDTRLFAENVRKAAVSGNLDAPEGGFDAIMQSIVCWREIGWREKARKLLVFSTDAGFHYAGDGKLGGVITPNDGECHLDRSGEYTHSTVQDYPSISHINQKVKENSVNIIFAVTAQQIQVYNLLSEHIEGSSSAILSNDSSNVVDLVKEEYGKISSSVVMKDNATSSLKITYYSSCLNNTPAVKTNKCDGLKVGNLVTFTAEITVVSCPANPADWFQTFQIYPVGLNESLIVDLEMLCDCPCEKEGHDMYEKNSTKCGNHGNYKCGVCDCDPVHFGQACECSTSDPNTDSKRDYGCRPPDNSTQTDCSGRGICTCGECVCNRRDNPEEQYSGKYCECENFSCDRHNQQLCSGPERGTCVCGVCVCEPGWEGPACDCSTLTDSCKSPDSDQLCNGNGECVCGQCICQSTDEGRWSGKYCEKCPTCGGRCHELKACVQCQQYKSGPLMEDDLCSKNCTKIVPIGVETVVADETNGEYLCTFYDDDDCTFKFVYREHGGKIDVRAQEERECPPKVFMLGIVLGVIAAIVLIGLALLMLWKLLTTIHDRREFARFEKDTMNATWDTGENPIYKQATSTFKNPTYAGK